MEQITKVDDNKIEIETTELKKEVVDIDNLLYERDSLVRTMENNYNDMVKMNSKIQTQIDDIDATISKARELGVKTDSEILAKAQADAEANLKKMYEENPPVDKPDEPIIVEGEVLPE